MADINKETLVQKLTDIADGFRTSRSLTETLSLDDMATLAAVPIGGEAENNLIEIFEGTATEANIKGVTKLRDYAFYNSTIEKITFTPDIKEMGIYCFNGCENLKKVYIENLAAWCGVNIGGAISNYGGTSPIEHSKSFYLKNAAGEYEIPTTLTIPSEITRLGYKVFDSAYNLQSVTIGDNIKEVGSFAFRNCKNLTSANIGSNVENFGVYAFGQCRDLAGTLILPKAKIIDGGAFHSTKNAAVYIGNNIEQIGNNAFYGSYMRNIYIDKPENSISGAPWGASNATIHWNTPLPSEEV